MGIMVTKCEAKMHTLFVYAEITPKPEHADDVKNAILNVLEITRQEEGNLSFDVFSAKDSEVICLFEEWKNQEALDVHYAMPYIAEVFAKYEGWLAKEPFIRKMNKLQKEA